MALREPDAQQGWAPHQHGAGCYWDCRDCAWHCAPVQVTPVPVDSALVVR